MAPQPTPPTPYSPEVQAWLMGLGPFPFGEAPMPLPPGSFGDEDQMDFMGDVLTTQKKGNDVISDPAQIAQFGTGPGGFSPGAFQPSIRYEPVKAPGYMQMQRYLQSQDPFLSYVARRLDENATAVQIEEEIANLINDGDEEMKAAVPKTRVDMNAGGAQLTVPTIDWNRVSNITSGLEKAIIEDPEFNAFDPNTRLPANEIREETEASRYFREMDLPNPYEQYSPDLLANPETLKRERENVPFTLNRTTRDAEAMLAKMLADERATASKMVRERGQQRATLGRTSPADLPEMPFLPDRDVADLPSSALSVADTGVRSAKPADSYVRSDRSSGRAALKQPNNAAPGALPKRDSTAYGQAYKAQMQAKQAQEDARFAQMERQRIIDAMTRAGYTPFNEVMRSRQSPIYGS